MTDTPERSASPKASTRLLEEAHRLPEAIQWHEGMLLEPQHFQQLSSWFEQQLHYHTAAIAPFAWGVRRFEMDADALRNGVVRVTSLEAVLPDGLIVCLANGAELTYELEPHKQELEAKPLPVHLAVAQRNSGTAVGGERARYDSVEGRGVLDENTADSEVVIPRLRPRLNLRVGETLPADYVGFPLTRVRYRDDQFIRAGVFVPPMFRVARSSPIGQICNAIIQRVWEKADALIRMRVPSASRRTQSVETKLMIQSLVMAAPRFQALLRTDVAHPFSLYMELCALSGPLSVLGDKQPLPPSLPAYDHNDLFATFDGAREAILRVLERSIVESFADYPFQLLKSPQGWMFYIEFDEEWTRRTLLLGVRGGRNMTDKDVSRWIDESIIASRSKIPELEKKRIRGAERSLVEGDGEFIPARGVNLFSLVCDQESIRPNEMLVIMHPAGGARPEEIVLYVKDVEAHRPQPVKVAQ